MSPYGVAGPQWGNNFDIKLAYGPDIADSSTYCKNLAGIDNNAKDFVRDA